MITYCKLRDALTYGLDHTCTVCHRNAAIGGRYSTENNSIVMVIERTRMQTDANFASGWISRFRHVDEFEAVQTTWSTKSDGLHYSVPVVWLIEAFVRAQRTSMASTRLG